MPNATLSFKLPEDMCNLECALKGIQLAAFQETVFQKIRDKLKYQKLKENQSQILEELRTELFEEKVELTEWE
jgi:hypothetical protein